MPGSPIRTPPDHSSVANSPGLIAGSYVLHRLSMPRHPPCALHSLSHKHSTETAKTRRRQPTAEDRRSSSHKRSRLVKRDRKMLASTIEFRRFVLAHGRPPGGGGSGRAERCRQTADSSGPNSVSGLVRVRVSQVPRSHRGGGSTEGHRCPYRCFVDDSTSEHHRCHLLVRQVCGVCAP